MHLLRRHRAGRRRRVHLVRCDGTHLHRVLRTGRARARPSHDRSSNQRGHEQDTDDLRRDDLRHFDLRHGGTRSLVRQLELLARTGGGIELLYAPLAEGIGPDRREQQHMAVGGDRDENADKGDQHDVEEHDFCSVE